jgi:peptidoglycan/xylan/chitin deacetylase (PgdA/CDA1 family)
MFSVFGRRRTPRVPVLTYHSLHTPGTDYHSNDHVALEEDLKVIRLCGFRVVDAGHLADAVIGTRDPPKGDCVAITFDDGVDFDYRDVERPGRATIKSFARILVESARPVTKSRVAWPVPCATSFVIASPAARAILDHTCIAGFGEWTHSWWREAHEAGVLRIGNHSWDHTHSTLPEVAQRNQMKGTFENIDTWSDADGQIRRAEDYIEEVLGQPSSRLFAVPYGYAVGYLCNEYLPNFRRQHRQIAAFETGGDYVTMESNRWRLPRFTCGEHWKAPEDLGKILKLAKRGL